MSQTAAKDKSTVFVRSVSFNVDETALEAAFADVGPIKQCFLVKLKGADKHRGFGFVQFALPEDAERAAAELNGKLLDGRKLQVELADKRAPMEERKRKRAGQAGDAEGGADRAAEPAAASAPAQRQKDQQQQKQEQADKKAARVAASKAAAAAAAEAAASAAVAAPTPAAVAAPLAAQKRKAAAADEPAAALPPAAKVAASAKHRLLRAVAIGNLNPRVTPMAVSLACKLGKAEEVLNPAPEELVAQAKLKADGCSGDVVVVVYSTVAEAMDAVSKLHGRIVSAASPAAGQQSAKGKKGKKGGNKGKKGGAAGEAEEAPTGDAGEGATGTSGGEAGDDKAAVQLWCRQVSGEGAHMKKWRVIVRNLPFKATEGMVRAALQADAGFVWDLKLPRDTDGRIKGFAFAAFTCLAHAQKAILKVNGKEIGGRTVAVDWAVEKDKYEAAQKKAGAPQKERGHGADESEDEEDGEAGEGEERDEGEQEEGEEEEDEGKKEEEERAMLRSVLDDVLKHEGGEGEEHAAEEDSAGRQQQAAAAKKNAKQGAKEQPQQAAKGDKAQAQKAKGKGAEEQAPVGGPDASPSGQQQQREAFLQERRGPDFLGKTVFVRGLALDVSQVELQARMETFGPVHMCRIVMDKDTGKPKGTAFVEYKSGADAGKASAACERGRKGTGPGITLGGRPLEVDLALNQDDARALAAGAKGPKIGSQGRDKRNVYLAKEGLIEEGSAAWNALSESDKQKRKRAAEEMKQKLKSPNFMLSPTRLSLRNLPYDVTEAQLKALVIAAVKERATKADPHVVHVKLLRETERLGEDGKPRSKGMGFVELGEHDHAVAALRQLNNNPKTFGPNRRPIVEFSVENVKVLKKLADIKAKKDQQREEEKKKRVQRKEGQQGEGEEGAGSQKGGKQGKGQREEGKKQRGKPEAGTREAGDDAAGPQKGGKQGKGRVDQGGQQQQQVVGGKMQGQRQEGKGKRGREQQQGQVEGQDGAGTSAGQVDGSQDARGRSERPSKKARGGDTAGPAAAQQGKQQGKRQQQGVEQQREPRQGKQERELEGKRPAGPEEGQGQGGQGGGQVAAGGTAGDGAAQGLSKRQLRKEQTKQLREKQKARRQNAKERKRLEKAQGQGQQGEVGQKAQVPGSKPAAGQQKQQGKQLPKQQGKQPPKQQKGGKQEGVRQEQQQPQRGGLKQQRGLKQEQEEATARRRKREADDAVDRLASTGVDNGPGQAKRRRRGDPETDQLDKLVEQYKTKFLGGTGSQQGKGRAAKQQQQQQQQQQQPGAASEGLRRWFE